jgi:hypothetical protein
MDIRTRIVVDYERLGNECIESEKLCQVECCCECNVYPGSDKRFMFLTINVLNMIATRGATFIWDMTEKNEV